jgi:hypothetical protein
MMSKTEMQTIRAIADRAVGLYRQYDSIEERDVNFVRTATVHEVTIVHREIVPLRLSALLAADKVDFVHDILGIHRHLDSSEQMLTECFHPRFAKPT